MEPFATGSDVADRWRVLTAAELVVATNLAADASDMIREQIPTIDDLITAGTVTAAAARRVVVSAVKRAMRNPAGLESRTRSIDDYTSTERYFDDCRGDLVITADDLLPLTPTGSAGAFTITPYGYAHNARVEAWQATL